MSTDFEHTVQAALDGSFTEEAQARLNDALRSDPAALKAYCDQMRMHALLAWRAGAGEPSTDLLVPRERKVIALPSRLRLWRWCGWAAAALLMLGLLIFSLTPSPATAAAAVMAMQKALQRGNRSYAISVLAGDPQMVMNNGGTLSYEGAVLHLRGDRQFVLVRPIIEGGQRFTGSDGTENWDFSGNGPVKVSRDPKRFRGGLPGEQQDAVFLDFRGQLSRLQSGYDISLEDVPGAVDLAMLKARKKNRDVRGPNDMQLTFRRESGVIVTLEMHGLPRARGGPDALRLTLTSDTALPPDFFSHAAHHEPGRPVEDVDR